MVYNYKDSTHLTQEGMVRSFEILIDRYACIVNANKLYSSMIHKPLCTILSHSSVICVEWSLMHQTPATVGTSHQRLDICDCLSSWNTSQQLRMQQMGCTSCKHNFICLEGAVAEAFVTFRHMQNKRFQQLGWATWLCFESWKVADGLHLGFVDAPSR